MVSAFEQELICERTAAGRVAAKNRGVRLGRPLKLNSEQQKLAHRLIAEGKPVSEIAKIFGVHVTTIYGCEGGRIGAAHCWAAPSSEPTVRLSTQ